MGRESFSGRTALVTGGSSGIGYEMAKLLAEEGSELILTASDPDKLSRAAERISLETGRPKPYCIAKDLSDPSSPRGIFQELEHRGRHVDLLLNNAGFGLYGPLRELDAARMRRMIEVNVQAPVELARLFLPPMLERGWGRVLNVASTAAFQAIPREQVYAASKAFVLLFSEALSEEVSGTGVRVTCLCPGATRTPFFGESAVPASPALESAMMDAGRVARIGIEAMRRGKPLAVAGLRNDLLRQFERLAPRAWAVRVAGRVVEARRTDRPSKK